MLLLSGCMLATDKPDLGLEIPSTYKMARGKAPGGPPALDWWRGFRSSELTGLIQEAQTSNLEIAAAIARVQQADALARIAGSALLPFVEAGGNVSRRAVSRRTTLATAGLPSTSPVFRGATDSTVYAASLSAAYEIDFWGKNRAQLRAAEENAVAARYASDVVNVTTMASVANAYFAVLAAQDRLRIGRENLNSATRVYDLIRERVEAGTASQLETAQQQSLVANVRAILPLLEQTLQQNIAVLAVLIGRTPEQARVRGGGLGRLAVPAVAPGVPADLLVQRPDIRQAEALLAAANANVEVARAEFLPSINLTAQGGYQSALLRTLFTPEAQFYSLAAGLIQPIFQGGLLIGNLEQQKARRIELLNFYRLAVIAGITDVDNALVAVQQSALRERLQRDVVTSSRQAFEIAVTRLREGTVDQVTVLTTQQTLFQAEDNLITARLARFLATVSLFQALGGGWTPAPLTRTAERVQ